MGSCISSSSDGNAFGCVRVLLVGCPGASTQSVLQQLVGNDGGLKGISSCPASNTSQKRMDLHSPNLRSIPNKHDILTNSKLHEDEKDEEHRFELDGVQFTLFCPVCSSTSFSSASLQKKMQEYVGKVDMVLFVVPLTWYNVGMIVEDKGSKKNRMEFAMTQFRTLCQTFANTDAGVGLILEDWAGLVDKLTMPKAGQAMGDHFLDYPVKDEGNPASAARYFGNRFQKIYDATFTENNCFIYVACPDKSTNDSSNITGRTSQVDNKLAGFLLESVKSVMTNCHLRSLLVGDECESATMSTIKNHKDHTRILKDSEKGTSGNSQNGHWMASNMNDSFTSITVTEEDGDISGDDMCISIRRVN